MTTKAAIKQPTGGKVPSTISATVTMIRMRLNQKSFGLRNTCSSSDNTAGATLMLANSIPNRRFSFIPKKAAIAIPHAIPAICGTIIGLNKSITGISNDVAARKVGPPQGNIFIVPAPKATIVAKIRRSIFSFS